MDAAPAAAREMMAAAAAAAAEVPRFGGEESPVHVPYGTAGFRCPSERLDAVVLRMGMLAALRARGAAFEGGAAAVGVMITASHNREPDNGLKMVDPSGGMLDQAWEPLATALANAPAAAVEEALWRVAAEGGAVDWARAAPTVVVGRDTRASSGRLHALLLRGVRALGGEVVDLGVVPTPVVHWSVMRRNAGLPAAAEHYYDTLRDAFRRCLPAGAAPLAPLLVDCANGVGSVSVAAMRERVGDLLELRTLNAAGDGELNAGCGAEHVQKQRALPAGVDGARDAGAKLASVDGDADRLVYFYTDAGTGALNLLDGDKITSLVCEYLLALLRRALGEGAGGLELGAVQTAYANGASTRYIESLGVPVACVPTGVKHIHHKAEEYDIGVYFEANGHGTVLFGPRAREAFAAAAADAAAADDARDAARTLVALADLVNQAIGDAVSDVLLVEVALAWRGGGLASWAAMYTDLPSRMTKVRVRDRAAVRTADAERQCVAPAGLQDRVNAHVAKFQNARSFVRPSGTEDVVRVYAEASTQEDADELARLIGLDVVELVGGPASA